MGPGVDEQDARARFSRTIVCRKRVMYVTKEEEQSFSVCRLTCRWSGLPAELLLRVERAGIVSAGRVGERKQLIPWERIHFVVIENRPTKAVDPKMLELIRAIMNDEFVFPETGLYTAFGAWASGRIGGSLTPATLRVRLLGYRPEHPWQGWGIIYQIRGDDGRTQEYAIAVPGFEPYTFVAQTEEAVESGQEAPAPSSSFVIEDDDERKALRKHWKTKHAEAVADVRALERELAESEQHIDEIQTELDKVSR